MTIEIPTAVRPVDVPAWTWALLVLAVFAIYTLTLENGAILASRATALHELFHDARHFIGVPCH
jgi:hypothetical protein